MEMVGLQSGVRIDRFDRFGKAVRVIREGRGDMESKRFSLLEKWPGILSIFRRCFMGYEDPVMLILHHHHTVVSPQRVGAITMTRSRRSDGK